MSVKIRLKRAGSINQPRWRVVVADARSPREGRFIEEIGFYSPTMQPAQIKIKLDRYKYWVGTGAVPSNTVRSLVKKVSKA